MALPGKRNKIILIIKIILILPKDQRRRRSFPSKIGPGIPVTNVLNHRSHLVNIVRDFAPFYFFPEEIAEQAPEIFMAGVRQEAAGVGEHSYKAGNKPHIGQRV